MSVLEKAADNDPQREENDISGVKAPIEIDTTVPLAFGQAIQVIVSEEMLTLEVSVKRQMRGGEGSHEKR